MKTAAPKAIDDVRRKPVDPPLTNKVQLRSNRNHFRRRPPLTYKQLLLELPNHVTGCRDASGR